MDDTLPLFDRTCEDILWSSETINLSDVFNSSNVAIWDWNLDTNRLYWNETMYRIHGLEKPSPGEHEDVLMNDNYMNSVHPDDRETLSAATQAILSAKEGFFYCDWRVIQQDLTTIHLKCRAEVSQEQSGKHLIGICVDISELVSVSRSRSKEVSSKDRLYQLIRTTCHEMRNPLQGIMSCSEMQLELLERKGMACDLEACQKMLEEVKILARDIHTCAHHQECVISDLLNFDEEVSSPKLPIITSINVVSILKSIHTMFHSAAQNHGTSIILNVPDSLYVYTDEQILKRIVINLVSNAVKFTEQGTAIISLLYRDSVVTISVADSGRGIPDAIKKDIFYVAGITTQSEYIAGSGLGLCIVHKLTTSLHGSISFHDNVPKGTIFTLQIPCKVSEPPLPTYPKESSVSENVPLIFTDLDIVVADDNIVNRKILLKMLQSYFREVIIVENGLLALETCRKCMPSFVILDVHMPVMNGVEAATEIRKLSSDVPLIFLTGEIEHLFTQTVNSLKPSRLLLKPVSKKKLLIELQSLGNIS